MKKQSHYLKHKVMEKRKHTLVENADEKRYEFDLGDDIAIIEYIKTQGFIILTHTEVPEKYEGQGIGRRAGARRTGGSARQENTNDPPVPLRRPIYPPPSRMGGRGTERNTRQINRKPASRRVSCYGITSIQKSSVRNGTTGRPRMLARLPGMKSRNPYRTATGGQPPSTR